MIVTVHVCFTSMRSFRTLIYIYTSSTSTSLMEISHATKILTTLSFTVSLITLANETTVIIYTSTSATLSFPVGTLIFVNALTVHISFVTKWTR